jgi:hypothetical protein
MKYRVELRSELNRPDLVAYVSDDGWLWIGDEELQIAYHPSDKSPFGGKYERYIYEDIVPPPPDTPAMDAYAKWLSRDVITALRACQMILEQKRKLGHN